MSKTPTQDVSAIPIAWASSVGWRANQLMSAEQYRQCLPKNRADFDVPLYGPDALDNYRRLADENQQDAARFRMLLQQHKHWLGIFRCDPDGAPSDSLDHVELKALLDQLIAPMCVWCEQRVQGACKSHYDTMTCTHRVFVPTAEQWDSAVEARNGEPTHPAQWSAGYDAGFKDGHQAACEALQRDAERYRWLRLQDWDTCQLAVVANPKEAIKLGHDAPSRERLDAMIDAPLAEVRAAVNSALERAGRSDLGA